MKIFITIWILFILRLGCVPCADGLASCQSSSSHEEEHNFPHSSDGCTPFCSCMCHGAIVTVDFEARSTKLNLRDIIVENSMFQDSYSDVYVNTIWQPPTLF